MSNERVNIEPILRDFYDDDVKFRLVLNCCFVIDRNGLECVKSITAGNEENVHFSLGRISMAVDILRGFRDKEWMDMPDIVNEKIDLWNTMIKSVCTPESPDQAKETMERIVGLFGPDDEDGGPGSH